MIVVKGISIDIDGATEQGLTRGFEAAVAVFRRATPAGKSWLETAWKVAVALQKREAWDIEGFDEAFAPTDEQLDICDLWDEADKAAVAACCAGWPEKPRSADLELDYDDDGSREEIPLSNAA